MSQHDREPIEGEREAVRFTDAVRKIVSVPKKEVDKQLEKERRERLESKKRKA